MRIDWDKRARENARHYVATSKDEWSDEDFFESGRTWIGFHILPYFDVICGDRSPSNMHVLEIGCGAGRMTLGLSEMFKYVDAVDVSPEMVARAQSTLGHRQNIRFHVNNGMDLKMFSDSEFDFVFSTIVFQHIPSKFIVGNYVKEAYRVLRRGSVFKFQVQGCIIPEEDTDTWVGVGFSQDEMAILAKESGFRIHSTTGAGRHEYWLTFHKQ
jgi:SAM-dependent methyltransferase